MNLASRASLAIASEGRQPLRAGPQAKMGRQPPRMGPQAKTGRQLPKADLKSANRGLIASSKLNRALSRILMSVLYLNSIGQYSGSQRLKAGKQVVSPTRQT